MGGVAGRAPRGLRWGLADPPQEGRGRGGRLVWRRRAGGPLLRLDRWPGEEAQRPLLAATVHPSPGEEHLVTRQPGQGAGTDRTGRDAVGWVAGGRAGAGRRTLGGGL